MAAIPNTQWVEQTLNDLTPRMAKAINSVFSPFVGGARYLMDTEGKPRSWRGFAESAWGGSKDDLTGINVGKTFKKDQDGNILKDANDNPIVDDPGFYINGGKVATTGVGLGLGYRALSGGGVYRDKDGNTDLAGIPFV